MKKNLHLLSLFFLAGAGIVLASCSTDDNTTSPSSEPPAGHEHSYVHHDAVSATCTEAGTIEYYTCSGCDKYFDASKNEIAEANITVAALGHDYGAWVVTTPATDTEQGEETRVCSHDPSHKETRAIMPTGHSFAFSHFEWNANHTSAKAVYTCPHDDVVFKDDAEMTSRDTATCTLDGEIIYTASYDGHQEDQVSAISIKKGHTPLTAVQDPLVKKAPSCDEDGYHDEVVYCAVCGGEVSRTHIIDSKHGHSFTDWVIEYGATCTEDGQEIAHCDHNHEETQTRIIPSTGHNYVKTTVPPTCEERGCDRYECSVCHDIYYDNYVPALGHRHANGSVIVPSCTEDQPCAFCDKVVSKVGHNYHQVGEVSAATCTEYGIATYTCERCGDTYQEKVTLPLGHHFDDEHMIVRVQKDANNNDMAACYKERVYTCTNDGCDHQKIEKYVQHTETAEIIKEATCQEAGIKRYTCSVCGNTRDVEIALDPNNHVWELGTPEGNLRVDHCKYCSKTREVTVISGNTSGNDLKGKEIAVDNASSIKLDDGLIDGLKGDNEDVNINIQVNTVDKATLGLSQEQSNAIRGDNVYDFNLFSNDVQQSDLPGDVTITLPYVLGENEDPDHIAVWYIPDGYDPLKDGALEAFPATYANGYITFSTNHFSYYTATSLSGRDICELYGCNYATEPVHVEGDCTHHAYDLYSCSRCHEVKTVITDPNRELGHNPVLVPEESLAPTCENSGYNTYRCSECGKKHVEYLAALGHDWGDPIEEVPATCTTDGHITHHCDKCNQDDVEILYATGHNFVFSETVNPTCESYGYDLYVCSNANCDKTLKKNYTEPLGHDYELNDGLSTEATCTSSGENVYVCSHGCGSSYSEVVEPLGHTPGDPVVATQGTVNPTCTSTGYHTEVVYCTECGEEISSQFIIDPALGHTPGEHVHENETSSSCTEPGSYDDVVYCEVCNEELSRTHVESASIGHQWGGWILTTKPTCTEKGEETRYCEHDHSHVETREVDANGHTPGKPVKENEVAATCTTDGSYDLVTYCTVCGAEVSRETVVVPATGHNYGPWTKVEEADCTHEGLMQRVCANDEEHIETMSIPANGHVPGNSVVENEVPATCTEHGSYDVVTYCTICGEEISRAHYNTEPLGHNYGAWVVTTEPTCTTPGVETRTCANDPSHTETRTTSELGHSEIHVVIENEVPPTCTEEGHYEQVVVCDVCKEEVSRDTIVTPSTGHTWGEWVNVSELSCTQDLVQQRECSVCHAQEERTIVVANGHIYDTVKENIVAPTCTQDGHHDEVSVCRSCGEHDESTRVTITDKATGHTALPAAKENEVAATCTEDGGYDMVVRCKVCGEVISSTHTTYDHFDHNYGAWTVTTEPTCTTPGVETRVCANDPTHKETREIPATGHSPLAAVKENEIEATCDVPGNYDSVVYCSVCGDELSRTNVEIPALGHNYGAWTVTTEATCDHEGVESRVCSHDEEHVETRSIEKLPHTPAEAVRENVVEATCTHDGSYDSVVYCSVCGEEISRTEGIVIPAVGHEYGEWETTKEPTCSSKGERVSHCVHEGCEETLVEEIEKLPHTPGEAVIEDEHPAGCTTKGSYDEVIYCEVCGEELNRVEDIAIPATGHDYEAEFVFSKDYKTATVTLTCKHDSKHVITKTVNVAASDEVVCSEARDISYTAAIYYGGKSYSKTVVIEGLQLEHTPHESFVIENAVAPTCTEDGHHDEVIYCDVCHQELSRNENVVDRATGHQSSGTVVRENEIPATCGHEGSYDEVIYCDVCHEELSRREVIAPALEHDFGDWVTVIEPTCEKEGVEARYCSHDHAHQESRPIAKIDHVTGEIQYNTTHHYYVCSVCNKTVNQESHHFHSHVTQAATCGVDGVQHFECEECGYSYDAAIPMTNAHHYENGVCTVCGKVQDGTCDHSALHIEVIDLEELGYCGGVLKYRTCDCGEVVTINEEDLMDIGCDTSKMTMNQGMEVIDGVSVPYMEARCPTCGFGYKAYAEMIVEGCTQTQNMNIHFPGDGEHEDFLVANLSYSHTNHTNISTKTITFDGLTAVVTYEQCGKCNEILEVGVVDINEELTINKETYKDSATLTRNITTYSNDSGSVSIVFTETIDYKSSCLRVTTHSVVVKENGVTKLEKSDKPESEELHIWETTYELEPGKTCTDGYRMTQTCKTCGLTYSGGGSGHRDREKATLDFSEYGNGACTSRVDYMECPICHDGYYYNEISGLMNIHLVDYEHATQENITYKGVPAVKMTGVCADCGITVEMISYQKTSGCNEWTVLDITYYDSDEDHTKIVSFSDNTVNYQSNHNYQYSNVVFDNPKLGCEGGVSYDYLCTKCGEGRHVEHQTYHTTSSEKMETFEVRDASTDNVMIQAHYSTCEVCHKQAVKGMDIHYEFFESTGRNEVIDGVEHKINTYTNAANNLTVTVDRYEYKEGCYKYIVTSYEIVQNDEVLLSYSDSYRSVDHDFEYHVKFDDPELKCEGGYSGYKVCKDCGETETIEHESGHHKVQNDINLVEYGACEGTYVHSYECQLCGDSSTYAYHPKLESEYHYYEDHTDEAPHYYYTQHCEDCGYTETVIVETTVNQCETARKETTHITIGTYDQTFVRQSTSSNHQYANYSYTKLGKDCEDGLIITATCEKCGDKYTEQVEGHYYIESQVDFAKLGACGGYYSKNECICCHQSLKEESGYIYVDHEAHKFNGSDHQHYTDEKGVIHDVHTSTCSDCGLVYIQEQTLSPLGNCRYTATDSKRVTVGGQTFETSSSYSTTMHNYQYEYKALGEDCEIDGVSVRRYCEECGQEFESETIYSHQTTENRVDFDKYGFEGAYFTYQECAACHKDAGYNYYFLGEGGTNSSSRTYEGENGVSYYEVTAYNEVTGLKVINTEWEEKVDPCHVIEHETFVFLDRDGKVIFEKELVDKEVKHSYYYTFECEDEENECEGDYIVHEHCYNCDYSSSRKGPTGHVTYETGRVDLTNYGAAQGSYYAYHTCACGYESSIYLHVTDNLEYRYSEVDLEALPEGAFYPSVEYYVPKSADDTFSYKVTTYCLYDSEGSCCYHTYKKYEFGLDADGLNPAHVVTVADSSSVLRHEEANAVKERTNLEDGGYMIVETEACPRCGQSRVTTSYYDANDNLLRTIARDNYQTYYYDDEVKIITSEYQIFDTVFGPQSLLVSRKTQVEGSESYRLETYKRDPLEPCSYECTETYHYESSGSDDPKPDEGGNSYHDQVHDYSHHIHVEASCTQEYYDGYVCSICGGRQDNWNTRNGHYFEYDENLGKYVCKNCGLESETGEEGAIALENIKNDDAYIAGYALNQEIDFNVYFAIVDKESGEETTIERIVPQKHNTLRAYYLDKDVVANYFNDNELSQDNYDVRFVFVSNDASDTSIYSLTF